MKRLTLLAIVLLCFRTSFLRAAELPPADANLPDVPGLADDYQLRAGLDNCRIKFTREKTGVVCYVGGSITASEGWSQLVDADLKRRFPETKFTFVHAGIPSIDSSGHAFRLLKDVLQKGVPDLIFVEAAVNDLHNERDETERLRAMEGFLRRAMKLNPYVDIVVLHFAEPRHTADYEQGRIPEVIASHETVAKAYEFPSINIAHEVQRRIAAGQFEWARDFKDLHPAPFGHNLYGQAIHRLFHQAWAKPLASNAKQVEHESPVRLDPFCYDAGLLASPRQAENVHGFHEVANWKPTDKAGTREGFVGVPMFVGEHIGDSFTFRFEGRAIGLFLTAGPDTATIEYKIDQGEWKERDTRTHWSGGLHLPWVLMLETELPPGEHELAVRIAKPAEGGGTALRIRDIIVNGPALDLPKLTELEVKSTIDGTMQPSLAWFPETLQKRPAKPVPLLVYLHSWSGDYRQDNSPWHAEAVKRGWVYLHPDFRGINNKPAACGSPLARQDVLDAIEHVAKLRPIDRSRIYLAGTSGGGHMSMLMAAYFPDRFSAVSAWVGISDLAAWEQFHVKNGQADHYAEMTIACAGGSPGDSEQVDAEYRDRSPLFHLNRKSELPLDIAAGVTDGKTGSVPIMHSLFAFNAVAKGNGHETISDADVTELWEQGKLSHPQPSDQEKDPSLGRSIFLRRNAGSARVTIFDGGHEGLPRAACAWLEKQQRATK